MDQENVNQLSSELVDAVSEIFEAEAASNNSDTPMLQRALRLMQELQVDPARPEASLVPGCRHLSRLLDLGEAGPAARVAHAIRRLESTLAWAQNPRYNVENKGADFMNNYGWSALGLTGSSDMAFGVMLLGPGVTYPPTRYESEGIFLVIGGSPEWKSEDEPWTQVQAGDVICRPFGGSEGKKPGDEPMLALYAWMYQKP
jgi:hypothetical protein